jgi:hypothetical protein
MALRPGDFKAAGKGQRTQDLANSLPFSRPRSTRRVVESEDYGHPDGHLLPALMREPGSSPAREVWREKRGHPLLP